MEDRPVLRELADGIKNRFEPVEGERPWGVQQIDPSERFAALAVSGDDEGRHAAVWEVSSGRLVWAPERAHAIAWNRDASEVYVAGVRDEYRGGELRRYSWPGLVPRGGGRIPMDGYMYMGLAVSPSAALCAVADIDQHETCVRLYSPPDAEGPQKPVGAWETDESNLTNGLAFSPDETALIWTLGGDYYWWKPVGGQGPSEGGEFEVGHVCIWTIANGKPGSVRVIKVVAQLPRGWSADDPEDILSSQMFQGPLFLGKGLFRILPPTGEWKTYSFDGRELADPDAGRKVDIRALTVFNLPPAKP